MLAASSFCHHSVANASHRYEVQRSSCILCGISNSFIQIHIANSCPCFSCAWLLPTMRYNATEAQLHCAPDRTLGYAIFFSLPFLQKTAPVWTETWPLKQLIFRCSFFVIRHRALQTSVFYKISPNFLLFERQFQCKASPISCVLSTLNCDIRSFVLERTLNVRIWTNNTFSQTTLCFIFISSANQPFWYDLLRPNAVLPPNRALRVHGLR